MKQFQLRKIDLNSVPRNVIVTIAENNPKDEYNACKLSQLNQFEIKVAAIDLFLENMSIYLQASLSSRS